MEFKEPENQEPIFLDHEVVPFERDIGGNLFREYPFRFEIDGKIIEGKVQVRIDDSTWFDSGPIIRPFPLTTEDYDGYSISAVDLDLQSRIEKIKEYNRLHPLESRGQDPEYRSGNFLLLTLRFVDNNSQGFTSEQQQILKEIHVVTSFSNSIIPSVEGAMFFPNDINDEGPNFGSIAFGTIGVFYPADIGPLASNSPLTFGDEKVGPGHHIILPNNPELIQSTKFRFVHSP